MHIICNAFIMKICGKFQLSLFLVRSLSEYLLLTLLRVVCHCICEVYARIAFVFLRAHIIAMATQ